MRFLVGLARPRRIVLSSGARFLPDLGLQTRVEHATNVNLGHEAMLDEFEAPHLGKRNRRCWNHQMRPETMMTPAPARFFSRQPAEQLHGAIKSRRSSTTQTACPTEQISPNPSGAALQCRRYPRRPEVVCTDLSTSDKVGLEAAAQAGRIATVYLFLPPSPLHIRTRFTSDQHSMHHTMLHERTWNNRTIL